MAGRQAGSLARHKRPLFINFKSYIVAMEPSAEQAVEPAVGPAMTHAEFHHAFFDLIQSSGVSIDLSAVDIAQMTSAMARLSTEHPLEPTRETLSPGALGRATATLELLWVALKALAGPSGLATATVDQAVQVAREAARPLAEGLLALEASGGGLGLALGVLLESDFDEPARIQRGRASHFGKL